MPRLSTSKLTLLIGTFFFSAPLHLDATTVKYGGTLDPVVNDAVIPPLARWSISTGGQGAARAGYAHVSSSGLVVASASYSLFTPLSGVRFQPPPPAREPDSYSLPGLRSAVVGPSPLAAGVVAPISRDIPQGIDNGVAIANVSSQRVRVLLSLLDSSGNKFLESSVILASGEQLSRTLFELTPGVPEKFEGSLWIVASPLLPSEAIAPIAVTILQFGPGQFNEVPLTVVQ